MVGDSIDDMCAGYRAGAGTILVKSDVNDHIEDVKETDAVVNQYVYSYKSKQKPNQGSKAL